MKKEITYNESTVEIIDKDNWNYQAVPVKTLLNINPDLAAKIQKEVEHYLDNEEEIKAKKEAEEKKVLIEARTKQVKEFKNLVMTKHSELLKGYEVGFMSPSNCGYGFNPREFHIGDSVKIRYSGTVSSGSWGGRSKTTRVWLMTFDYKDRRYSTLERAIKSGIKLIEEKKAKREAAKVRENKIKKQEQILQKFAEDNGFKFEKDWNRSKYNPNGGYYSYSMSNDKITAKIHYNTADKNVVISSYTVKDLVGIPIEDLKRIMKN